MTGKGRLLLLGIFLCVMLISGCGKSPAAPTGTGGSMLVGMVTDAGTIDDKSFNQGTWEGLVKAGRDFQFTPKYLKPVGVTTADYEREIANLHDAGYRLIVTPGFKFENAVYTAQRKYADTKFVIIDGTPRAAGGTGQGQVAANTVAIYFAEEESGFLAGVAAALQVPKGEFGFIGGMEIPPVRRFNWGFQQGVRYANANLGTAVNLKADNILYQGTFTDMAAGQQLAARMYDQGVQVIFVAAGIVGIGVINEGIARAKTGRQAWVIGVDADQYGLGYYDGARTRSVILTSAMKYISQASYDMVRLAREGKFPGGQTLMYNVKNDGIGLPADNPNLSPATVSKVKEVTALIKSGALKVSATGDGLVQ